MGQPSHVGLASKLAKRKAALEAAMGTDKKKKKKKKKK